jgi:hypothetical protein
MSVKMIRSFIALHSLDCIYVALLYFFKKIKMPLFIFASGNCFLSGHRPWQDCMPFMSYLNSEYKRTIKGELIYHLELT